MNHKCPKCYSETDTGFNCQNGCDQSSGKTNATIELDASTKSLLKLQMDHLILLQENTELKRYKTVIEFLEGTTFRLIKKPYGYLYTKPGHKSEGTGKTIMEAIEKAIKQDLEIEAGVNFMMDTSFGGE